MRSSTTSGHNTPTATSTYSPSVPLSVYRELAAELQAAEATLDSLNAQNQYLAKQNQQLRQEIKKAVKSVLHLQQVVASTGAVSWTYADYPTSVRSESKRTVSAPRPMHRSSRISSSVAVEGSSPKVFTEQEEGRYRRHSQPKSASDGWWLAIAIVLIMAMAFGSGYLIVRPLLQSR